MWSWERLREEAFRNGDGVLVNMLEGGFEDCYVMQYTGLKDKNDAEIYEGDILRSFTPKKTKSGLDREFVRVVKWEEMVDYEGGYGMGWGFNVHQEDFEPSRGTMKLNPYEVIGNIYENPELVKGGDEKG
jgi:uncharacterized phage protein (TIGR01671 family)